MLNTRRDMTECVCATLALMSLVFVQSSIADEAKTLVDSAPPKKSMTAVLQGCSERDQRTSQALAKLLDKLADASKSSDPVKMKAALDDAQKSLADLKKDHEKSGAVMRRLHKKVESLQKQINLVRSEHEKASSLIEDEDMDDADWAY